MSLGKHVGILLPAYPLGGQKQPYTLPQQSRQVCRDPAPPSNRLALEPCPPELHKQLRVNPSLATSRPAEFPGCTTNCMRSQFRPSVGPQLLHIPQAHSQPCQCPAPPTSVPTVVGYPCCLSLSILYIVICISIPYPCPASPLFSPQNEKMNHCLCRTIVIVSRGQVCVVLKCS